MLDNENELILLNKTRNERELIKSSGKNIIDFNNLRAIYYSEFFLDDIDLRSCQISSQFILNCRTEGKLLDLENQQISTPFIDKFLIYAFKNDINQTVFVASTKEETLLAIKFPYKTLNRFSFCSCSSVYLSKKNILLIADFKGNIYRVCMSTYKIEQKIQILVENNKKKVNEFLDCKIICLNENFCFVKSNFYSAGNKCVIHLIDISTNQCKTSISIGQSKFYAYVNGLSGNICFEEDKIQKNEIKDTKVVCFFGYMNNMEIFDFSDNVILKKFTVDENIRDIRKIFENKYWFIFGTYFYIYDVKGDKFVQKIASLMTNNYLLNDYYFIFYSSKVIYQAKIFLEQDK